MRRPRPHPRTASGRRLVAAGILGALASAAVVTVVSAADGASQQAANQSLTARPAGVRLPVPLLHHKMPLPTLPLPSLPLPSLPLPSIPLPSLPLPSLPLPSIPLPSLPVDPPTVQPTAPPTPHPSPPATVPPVTSPPPTLPGGGPPVAGNPGGSGSGGSAGIVSVLSPFSLGPSAAGAVVGPRSPGLTLLAPPGVEQLTPLAGITFGQAPYLWPLFLLLDVLAAIGVVVAVRKSWSAQSPAD